MLKNGNIVKEKWEYTKERFTTGEGLADFFIGTAIWSYLTVNYIADVFAYISNLLNGIPFSIYITYLISGLVLTFVGMALTIIIVGIYKKIKKGIA